MRNDITIDFLSIIDEGVATDTEVEMTKCVAMKSPHYHGRLHVAVYHLKSNSPSVDERIDGVAYWFRQQMQFLN
jgi:hypothetical protein